MDAFDAIPDPVVIDILNKVGDVKTLIRCRSVSKRFNSLATQTDSLLLQLDQILGTPSESDSEIDSPFASFFRSLFKSIHGLLPFISRPADPAQVLTRSPNTPAQMLARFERIRNLDVELYGGDVKLEKGAAVKWKAEFGETLKTCVIVAFRSATVNTSETTEASVFDVGVESDSEFVCGLKTRVVWTISALMAASTRHYLMRDLMKEHKEMEKLTIRDREGEGTVVMDAAGMKEYRETEAREEEKSLERVKERTVVPSVRMSMRHAPSLKLKSGICLEAATLVVVRPISAASDEDDVKLVTEAFGGDCMYGEAVAALLKRRRNVLEMNSF